MIVVKIHAGLGNQLFQYAMGKALAHRFGCPFLIDTRRAGSHREIGIHAFNIEAETVAPKIARRLERRKTQWVRLVKLFTGRDIREGASHFITNLTPDELNALSIDPGTEDYYFDGYYQSARNFESIADTIRRNLTPRVPLEGANAELACRAAECPSVSLHVRRGDYFSPKYQATFGVPLTDYYHNAMRRMAEWIGNPHFYVFSDDHDWVRRNLRFEHPVTFVEGNTGKKTYCDILLMSACRNHITANSSFSWWGAWLNPRPEKKVVVPHPWFLKPEWIPVDIIPPEWTVLPAF
ncbi:MAG TPA: hypothetical protein DEB39_07550 [Planctomycetaceae bacterium]|nr:hypothetical protein [Planctomycetaceae bacterium]